MIEKNIASILIGLAITHGEEVPKILCGVLLVVQLEILEQYYFFN